MEKIAFYISLEIIRTLYTCFLQMMAGFAAHVDIGGNMPNTLGWEVMICDTSFVAVMNAEL